MKASHSILLPISAKLTRKLSQLISTASPSQYTNHIQRPGIYLDISHSSATDIDSLKSCAPEIIYVLPDSHAVFVHRQVVEVEIEFCLFRVAG